MLYETVSGLAKRANISPSTLKKYYLLIEKVTTYRFHRNEKGNVIFSEDDAILIRDIMKARQEDGITLEDACKLVVAQKGFPIVVVEEGTSSYNGHNEQTESFKAILTLLQQQGEEIRQLRQDVQEQKWVLDEQQKQQLLLSDQTQSRDEDSWYLEGNEEKKIRAYSIDLSAEEKTVECLQRIIEQNM